MSCRDFCECFSRTTVDLVYVQCLWWHVHVVWATVTARHGLYVTYIHINVGSVCSWAKEFLASHDTLSNIRYDGVFCVKLPRACWQVLLLCKNPKCFSNPPHWIKTQDVHILLLIIRKTSVCLGWRKCSSTIPLINRNIDRNLIAVEQQQHWRCCNLILLPKFRNVCTHDRESAEKWKLKYGVGDSN